MWTRNSPVAARSHTTNQEALPERSSLTCSALPGRTQSPALRAGESRSRQRDWPGGGDPLGSDGVVPPVAVTATTLAFFFDIPDFSTRRHLAIPSDDASAIEGGEAE